MICKKGRILIRYMNDEINDFLLMYKWLNNQEILKYYEGRDKLFTMDKIIDKYKNRTNGCDIVKSCIFEYNHLPIGYIQYYPIDEKEYNEYGYKDEGIIYGIDLFIGNTNYQNKGLGAQVINCLIQYIRLNIKPNKIVIDPRVENKRAIRCYEKCGFEFKKIIPKHELHEGLYHDTYLMEFII